MLAAESLLTVENISDVAAFSALRSAWNPLLAGSESDCLFLTWEWLFTWWQHLAGPRQLSILALYDRQELIALAPFAVHPPQPSFGHLLPVREFLGCGHAGSDYLDVLVRRGRESEVAHTLAARLSGEQSMFKWTNVRQNASAAALSAALAKWEWSAREIEINVCPSIPLEGATWTSYLAQLTPQHRYNWNRKWKRLNRDFAVQLEEVNARDQCRDAVDTLIRLHHLRWTGHGESDAFHTPALVAFHQAFVPLALEKGWLRLYVLRADDRPIAALYGFFYAGKFYFYQSGFDPAYEKYSPGLVIMGHAIRCAIEQGAHEFDLLHGNESYKSHWTAACQKLFRLELFPPGLAGRISRASLRLARVSRKVSAGVLSHCL